MRIKHIAFQQVDRDAWTKSQRRWLELSIESGGLVDAWGAEARGEARAVFTWRDADALQRFMELTHDRALAHAGAIGRSAVLYVDDVEDLGPREGATYVGEAIAWVKESGVEPWLESQRVWSSATKAAEGFVGGSIRRGRRTFVVTSFWRDQASHRRFLERTVPGLRTETRGDEHTARLVRFEGHLVDDLSYLAR